MIKYLPILFSIVLSFSSCKSKVDYDASGNFEADEVIVSAEQNGTIQALDVEEGKQLNENTIVGQIDVAIPRLQKLQTEATIASLRQKTSNPSDQTELVKRQLAVQQAELDYQYTEKKRIENLVHADAATRKDLDDINAKIDQQEKKIRVTEQQIKLNTANTETMNRSVLSEKAPLEVSARTYQEQIDKGQVVNPVKGTVLSRYALKGEMAIMGKPLYKIASLDTLTLKAYITGDKLTSIKLSQPATVRIDDGNKSYKKYPGWITWIADKSEFTPKTIQTKDERANLVYAIKVRVKNDGYIKIGMFGEVILDQAK